MTADIQTNGFPDGYFVVRSAASKLVLDVATDDIEDGTEIILWPAKESSLVETFRSPDANNQVFFIDTSGALCSRSSGHAIDIEDNRLVLRHRRPISLPFPNTYAHPLPKFSYSADTGEITVNFTCDPAYPPASASPSNAWKANTYVLASIPVRKPRTILDDASAFISSAFSTPLSMLSGKSPVQPTPEEVYDSRIDLDENEVLEEERGEEAEVDDSPELGRKVRMLSLVKKSADDLQLVEKAKNRRRWEILPLRLMNARTGAL